VHYDSSKYGSVGEALGDPNGLAVVGIMIAVDDEKANTVLEELSEVLHHILHQGETIEINPFAVSDLLPKNKEYFRYEGSLTTPNCAESVIWTVLMEPIYISHKAMSAFREVYNSEGEELELNNRPVQPLNGRVVKVGED